MPKTNTPPGTGWDVQLLDGTTVCIRPSDRRDAKLELDFLNHLSPEIRKSRFLGLIHDPSPEVARELTDVDPATTVALIALISRDGRDQQIGAAHFQVNAAGDHCDASLTVSDPWRKRGVGSFLMRHLVAAARARGIRHMRAYAPLNSAGGDHLATLVGFERQLDPRDPATVIYDLRLQ